MCFVKIPSETTVRIRVSAHQTDPLTLMSLSVLIVTIDLSFKTYRHKVIQSTDLQSAWSFDLLTGSLEIIQHFRRNPQTLAVLLKALHCAPVPSACRNLQTAKSLSSQHYLLNLGGFLRHLFRIKDYCREIFTYLDLHTIQYILTVNLTKKCADTFSS